MITTAGRMVSPLLPVAGINKKRKNRFGALLRNGFFFFLSVNLFKLENLNSVIIGDGFRLLNAVPLNVLFTIISLVYDLSTIIFITLQPFSYQVI